MAEADLDLVRRLIGLDHGLAVVSVARIDRSVQSSVVNAGVLGHPVTGDPVIGLVAQETALKLRILRSNPRANVVFRSGWEWVSVEGPTQIIGPDDPVDGVDVPALLRNVFSAAGGTHDDWDEYDRTMAAERRAAVLVTPGRITTN
jgi:hypothetical protein